MLRSMLVRGAGRGWGLGGGWWNNRSGAKWEVGRVSTDVDAGEAHDAKACPHTHYTAQYASVQACGVLRLVLLPSVLGLPLSLLYTPPYPPYYPTSDHMPCHCLLRQPPASSPSRVP